MTRTVLEDVIDVLSAGLTLETARRISELRASPATQARFDQLADKSNEGTLTASECTEYDELLVALHLITILQARARGLLKGQ